jgi:hypothetical protein
MKVDVILSVAGAFCPAERRISFLRQNNMEILRPGALRENDILLDTRTFMKKFPRLWFIVFTAAVISCQLPALLSPPATQTPVIPTLLIPTDGPTDTVNPPVATAGEIEAEVSLPDVALSADGTVIRIGIAVLNHGEAFTLSVSDVSLVQQDATPLAMVSSEPRLPKEIAAGAEEILYFVFPRPTTPTATLKVLTTEYAIEGY